MIPLYDDNPTRSVAYVTIGLIVLNTLVFLYELSLPPAELRAFIHQYGVTPVRLTAAGTAPIHPSLLTSMFLHGGWMHLLGNMLYLWIFGNNIEDACGRVRFLFFYLLTGLAAAATQIFIHPESDIPMIGASGAVSGVLGGYLLLYPRARVLVLVPIFIFIKFLYVPAIVLLVFWFALQLLSGWATLGHTGGGVAFWAHVGGFVAGMALIPFFKKRRVRLFR